MPETLEARFWKHVLKTEGCWTWQSKIGPGGYGYFKIGNHPTRYVRAHRFSFEMHSGEPVPTGMFVCHRCDRPACVRFECLFLGTPQDNVDDMIAKGRKVIPVTAGPGESNGRAILSEEDVLHIRESRLSKAELAAYYRVHPGHVKNIRLRKRWSHLP